MNPITPLASILLATVILLVIPACSEQSAELADRDAAAAANPLPQGSVVNNNINLGVLAALDQEFASGDRGYIDGMLVLHGGKVVYENRYAQDYRTPFEAYEASGLRDGYWGEGQYHYLNPQWHPWLKDGELHTMQSVTKSVTSALIGIAIAQGAIPSTDVEVQRYFNHPNPFQGDPRSFKLTLHDLLTMSAGIDWNESDYSDASSNDCVIMEHSDDWVTYVLDQGMVEQSGVVFNYNSGISVLLDQILFSATGSHADAYARKHLFGPLGIDDFFWKTTPTGTVDTEGGLYLSPRSLARIGELYANDGVWNGERIFQEGWVQDSFSPAISVGRGGDWMYGYQWWLLPDPGLPGKFIPAARGYGGQYLLILAEDDVIAVFNGWNIHPGTSPMPVEYVIGRLIEAVR